MPFDSNIPTWPQGGRIVQAVPACIQLRSAIRSDAERLSSVALAALALLAILAAPHTSVAQTFAPTSTSQSSGSAGPGIAGVACLIASPSTAAVPPSLSPTSTAPGSAFQPPPVGGLSTGLRAPSDPTPAPVQSLPYIIIEPAAHGSSSATTVVFAPDAQTAADGFKDVNMIKTRSLSVTPGCSPNGQPSGATPTITSVSAVPGSGALPYQYQINGSGFGYSASGFKLIVVSVALMQGCLDSSNNFTTSCSYDYFYGAQDELTVILGWNDSQITIGSSVDLAPNALLDVTNDIQSYSESAYVLTNVATGAAASFCWNYSDATHQGNNCQTTTPATPSDPSTPSTATHTPSTQGK